MQSRAALQFELVSSKIQTYDFKMDTYTCAICSRDSLQKTDHPTKKCPSLLSIICISCKKSGHVEKFCPEKLMHKNPVPVTDPNEQIEILNISKVICFERLRHHFYQRTV